MSSDRDRPGAPACVRIAVLHQLARAARSVEALLVSYLDDDEADVREAAALAIAARGPGRLGEALVARSLREPKPSVRIALYRALAEQVYFDLGAATDIVRSEPTVEARMAGFAALAAEAARRPARAAPFDQEVVPELVTRALHTTDERAALAAVDVLSAATTNEARRALRMIARLSRGSAGSAARSALAGGWTSGVLA